MGKKTCVVKSCPSGRVLKTKVKSDSSQSLSYFRATTTERLQRWKESLGIDLNATHNICHLHFKEQDIKWYDKFIINGETKVFPAVRKVLKNDALPTVEHQFVPVHFNELDTISQKHCDVEKHNIKQENVIEPQFIEINLEPWSTLSQDADGPASHQETEAVHFSDLDTIPQKHCEVENHDIKQEKIVEPEFIEFNSETWSPLSQDADGPASHQETETRTATSHQETEARIQLDDFRDNMAKYSMVPPSWLYLDKPNGLEFIRMNLATKQITNHLRLNEDISITVIFPNNEELSLNDKIYSFRDIYDYLKSVERWPLCVGTQMGSKKYSTNCKGVIIGAETYQRCWPNPRCKSCRILRKRLQTNKKQRTLKLHQQCEHLRKILAATHP